MEKDKESIFSKISKLIKLTLLLVFPSVRILSFNKMLKRCNKIAKDPWFNKQIRRDYIIAILLLVPIVMNFSRIGNIYSNDVNFQSRIDTVSKMDSVIDRVPAYYHTVVLTDKDTAEQVSQKIQTQIRLTAILLILSIAFGIQIILAFLISHYHPISLKTEKLEKLLLANGVIRKEDLATTIVFATPIGFLITITGSSAKEVAYMDRIWAGLNLRIKDWIEDEDERSLVFFRKAFELQNSYMYNNFPTKK